MKSIMVSFITNSNFLHVPLLSKSLSYFSTSKRQFYPVINNPVDILRNRDSCTWKNMWLRKFYSTGIYDFTNDLTRIYRASTIPEKPSSMHTNTFTLSLSLLSLWIKKGDILDTPFSFLYSSFRLPSADVPSWWFQLAYFAQRNTYFVLVRRFTLDGTHESSERMAFFFILNSRETL